GLHLAAVGRVAAARRRVVGAAQLRHLALGVLHHLAPGDEIGVAQAYLAAGREAIELFRRVLHEIVALDIELATERNLARALAGIIRMIDRLELLALAARIVLDDHLERPQHGHAARRSPVEVFADGMLEHLDIDDAVGARHADALDEIADRLGRHAAPA